MVEADASRGRKVKLRTWPEAEKITRPVPEYLAALDEAAAAEAAEREDSDNDMRLRQLARGTESDSLTDPARAWTNKGQAKVRLSYGTNYTPRPIIVDIKARRTV